MSADLSIQVVQKYSKWSLVASLVIFVCGILSIILPLTFSFGIAIIIGSVVLVAGIAHLVFAFHTRSIGGFLLHMLLFAVYEMAAIFLLANPLLSLFSLVLLPAMWFEPKLRGLWPVAAFYALAKVAEFFDVGIFSAIAISGHTVKHLGAALATYWILRWRRAAMLA